MTTLNAKADKSPILRGEPVLTTMSGEIQNETYTLLQTLGRRCSLRHRHRHGVVGPNLHRSETQGPLIACRSERRKKCTPFLAEELIDVILGYLPAYIIYNAMRYVCRDWYKIIHNPAFVRTHLMESNPGLLIQKWRQRTNVCYVELRDGKVETTMAEIECLKGLIQGSCHGLAVFLDSNDSFVVRVINPVTKQIISLPRFFSPLQNYHVCSIGYVASCSGIVYKVVHKFRDREKNCWMCGIIIIGNDEEWRYLDWSHLSPISKVTFGFCHNRPISVGTRLFWTPLKLHPVILMLNLETETLDELPYPESLCDHGELKFMSMGDSLCCFAKRDAFIWLFWELISEPGGSVWTKILKIDLSGKIDDVLRNVCPHVWLKRKEVLVFQVRTDKWIVHNVLTGDTFPLQLPGEYLSTGRTRIDTSTVEHVNSLISLSV